MIAAATRARVVAVGEATHPGFTGPPTPVETEVDHLTTGIRGVGPQASDPVEAASSAAPLGDIQGVSPGHPMDRAFPTGLPGNKSRSRSLTKVAVALGDAYLTATHLAGGAPEGASAAWLLADAPGKPAYRSARLDGSQPTGRPLDTVNRPDMGTPQVR